MAADGICKCQAKSQHACVQHAGPSSAQHTRTLAAISFLANLHRVGCSRGQTMRQREGLHTSARLSKALRKRCCQTCLHQLSVCSLP